MINLFKSIFRYIFSKKIWLLGLTFLLTLSLSIFTSTTFLSQNLSNSYNTLVEKGNLNNITIYERYKSTYSNPNDPNDTLEGEAARKKNEELFLSWLKVEYSNLDPNLPPKYSNVQFNKSRSLEIGNNSNNFLYKAIESNPTDEVNKLVINTGNNLPSLSEINFKDILDKASWNAIPNPNNPNESPLNMRKKLLDIVANSKWTQNGINATASKIYIALNGTFPDPLIDPDIKVWQTYNTQKLAEVSTKIGLTTTGANPDMDLKKFLNNFESWINPSNIDPTSPAFYNPPSNLEYKINFNFRDSIAGVPFPTIGYYENFSNLSAVIPDYSLKNLKKEILPPDLYNEYLRILEAQEKIGSSNINSASQENFETFIESIPTKNKILIDGTSYLILGTGITPNYMYPIINFENSIPNPDNELLIYMQNSGYERILYSFRDNPTENYIVMKVDTNSLRQKNISVNEAISSINEKSIEYMSWPSDIKSTYLATDTSNFLSPAPLRLDFLPKLLVFQHSITDTLSIFILMGSLILCIFFVSKFIKDNKSVLGIMIANGLNRRYILFSVSVIGIIPSIVAGIISWLIAFFTQNFLFTIYQDFWFNTFETVEIDRYASIWFFILIFIPMIIMAIVSVSVVFFKIEKEPVVEMMENNSKYKTSLLSGWIKKMFTHTPVLVRFRSSVAFASISKTIYITIMIAISTLMITISSSTTNIFSVAQKETSEVQNYNYAFDLASPTRQGGQYFRSEPENMGIAIVNDTNEVLNNSKIRESNYKGISALVNYRKWKGYDVPATNIYGKNNFGLLGNTHFPSVDDSNGENTNMLFLKNIVQHQTALDINIAGVNPFDIVDSLASENILSVMDDKTANLWNKAINDNRLYRPLIPLGEIQTEEYVPEYYSQFLGLENRYYFNYEKMIRESKTVAGSLTDTNGTTTRKSPVFDFVSDVKPEVIDSSFAYREFHVNNAENPHEPNQPIWPKTGWYKINKKNLTNIGALQFIPAIELQPFFIWFLTNIYLDPYYQDDLYRIIFNYAPMLKNDIPYTYLEFGSNTNNENISLDKTNTKTFVARGIDPNPIINPKTLKNEFVPNLFNSNDENLNSELALKNENIIDPDNLNLLISEATAYKYNIGIGSKINIQPKNDIDRYYKKNENIYTFTIKGIYSSYYGDEFFINQKVANEILGYNDPEFNTNSYYIDREWIDGKESITGEWVPGYWEIKNNETIPFNGFFSLSKTHPILTSSNSTYSYSGLYPAIDTFSHSEKFTSILNYSLNPTSIAPGNNVYDDAFNSKIAIMKALNYPDVATFNTYLQGFSDVTLRNKDVINRIINTYGSSVFSLMNKTTQVSDKISGIFDTSENLIYSLQTLLFSILISISLLTTLIMSIDLIENSLSVAATLKALGFSDRSNMLSFLSAYFPPLILGSIIGFSLSSTFINMYINVIFNISSIYLPVTLNPLLFLSSLIINSLVVLIILGYGIYRLKNDDITKYM